MSKTKKSHKYDFRQLEDNLELAYQNYLKDDSPKTRTKLYEDIKIIAYGILEVGSWNKSGLDYELVSYEYAVYLFERLILRTFTPECDDRFPWQHYMRKNIRHIIFSMKAEETYHDLLDDLGFILEDIETSQFNKEPQANPVDIISRRSLANKLLGALLMFYTIEDIKRMYKLSLESFFEKGHHSLLNKNLPTELRDFSMVLVSLSKRLVNDNRINRTGDMPTKELKKALASSVRSTVFLSAVVNNNFFPKELLLSLDIDSLYRLVSIAGGQWIKIPTSRELDSLIGASVTVSNMIIEGKDKELALWETKKDMDLVFSSKVNLQYYISKVVESFNIFKDDEESDPLINTIAVAINSLKVLSKQMIEKESNPELVIEHYKEMSGSLNKVTDSLIKISTILKTSNNES